MAEIKVGIQTPAICQDHPCGATVAGVVDNYMSKRTNPVQIIYLVFETDRWGVDTWTIGAYRQKPNLSELDAWNKRAENDQKSPHSRFYEAVELRESLGDE